MAGVDAERISELFSSFGRVTVRRMFGGAGIFADGLMIGLISNGDIFLKADEATVPAFQNERMKQFVYDAKDRRAVMSYWRLPERLLDDSDELAEWARAAQAAARRGCAGKNRKVAPNVARKPLHRKKKKAR